MPLLDRAVVRQRAPRDLVHGRHDTGRGRERVELVEVVVAHADVAGQPLVTGAEQRLPHRQPEPVVRRPVDEPQVHVVRAEQPQALVQRLQLGAGAVRWQLRRDEHLGPRDAAVPQCGTDLGLVAVDRGGVDVAVADVEGGAGRGQRLVPEELPGAEAEQRHPPAVGQRRGVRGQDGIGHASDPAPRRESHARTRGRRYAAAMARHGQEPRAGDRLVRAGALVFVAGLGAVTVVFVPFAVDLIRHGARHAQSPRHEHGVALNLATFLVCAGLGLGLVGLLLQSRQSRRRARDARDAAP
jgi:hypothetical protein